MSDAGSRGLLADVVRFETWLHVALVVLTGASALRYVGAHGLGREAAVVLGCAGVFLVVSLVRPRRAAVVWFGALVVVWVVLVVLAPSFAWCAVPLAFVALRVLPFVAACVVVAGLLAVVVVAWTSMTGVADPTIIAGPLCVAVLAVVAYRALDREATARRAAEREAGAAAERARLSREIHDSVAQGLSSINLLLRAADQDWDSRPTVARSHVAQAALTARDGLDEVRQVVRDLAPPDLADPTGAALPAALRALCAEAVAHTPVAVEVHVHGDVVPVDPAVATALLRTARGALANVVEHSGASRAVVSLTYQGDSVSLDVRDDGRGFDPAAPVRRFGRGHGLAGARDRVSGLGGALVVESAPGEGTVLAVSVPVVPR